MQLWDIKLGIYRPNGPFPTVNISDHVHQAFKFWRSLPKSHSPIIAVIVAIRREASYKETLCQTFAERRQGSQRQHKSCEMLSPAVSAEEKGMASEGDWRSRRN